MHYFTRTSSTVISTILLSTHLTNASDFWNHHETFFWDVDALLEDPAMGISWVSDDPLGDFGSGLNDSLDALRAAQKETLEVEKGPQDGVNQCVVAASVHSDQDQNSLAQPEPALNSQNSFPPVRNDLHCAEQTEFDYMLVGDEFPSLMPQMHSPGSIFLPPESLQETVPEPVPTPVSAPAPDVNQTVTGIRYPALSDGYVLPFYGGGSYTLVRVSETRTETRYDRFILPSTMHPNYPRVQAQPLKRDTRAVSGQSAVTTPPNKVRLLSKTPKRDESLDRPQNFSICTSISLGSRLHVDRSIAAVHEIMLRHIGPNGVFSDYVINRMVRLAFPSLTPRVARQYIQRAMFSYGTFVIDERRGHGKFRLEDQIHVNKFICERLRKRIRLTLDEVYDDYILAHTKRGVKKPPITKKTLRDYMHLIIQGYNFREQYGIEPYKPQSEQNR